MRWCSLCGRRAGGLVGGVYGRAVAVVGVGVGVSVGRGVGAWLRAVVGAAVGFWDTQLPSRYWQSNAVMPTASSTAWVVVAPPAPWAVAPGDAPGDAPCRFRLLVPLLGLLPPLLPAAASPPRCTRLKHTEETREEIACLPSLPIAAMTSKYAPPIVQQE